MKMNLESLSVVLLERYVKVFFFGCVCMKEISAEYIVENAFIAPEFKGLHVRGKIAEILKSTHTRRGDKCLYCEVVVKRGSDITKPFYGKPIMKPYIILCDNHNTYFNKGDSLVLRVRVLNKKAEDAMKYALSRLSSFGKNGVISLNKLSINPLSFNSNIENKFAFVTLSPLILPKISLQTLVMQSARKYASYFRFYKNQEPDIDFLKIKEYDQKAKIRLAYLLKRWSKKRGLETIKAYGGHWYFSLPEDEEYLSIVNKVFSLAQFTGIGKRTTAGFGQFKILPLPLQ